MNLRALRADLGVVAAEAGFNAWDYQPDDVQDLPAAVVGGIKSMERLNASVTQIEIGVTFYVNAADPEDATATLDATLSVGVDGTSFLDWLDNITVADGPSWRSVRFASAGPYMRVVMPGGALALAVEITLELTA